MPIQFPTPLRGNPFDRWIWQWGARNAPQVQRSPNLARIGTPFTKNSLNPGFGSGIALRVNLRQPSIMYRDPTTTSLPNPANMPMTDKRVFDRVEASQNMILTGVSRDGAGSPLGNCRVMIFKTPDNSFVGETTSDGSGNWSYYVGVSGPFFLVEYKAGSPDVSGTSLNAILPVVG